jgi:hypothetical protein
MKALKLPALIAVLVLGILQAHADQTNLVQNLNLRLFGYQQGGTTTNRSLVVTSVDTVRMDTRQVMRALAAATANTFTPASKLVLVTPLDGGAPAIQVRDGENTVDVSGFFIWEQIGEAINSSVLNTRLGASVQNTYRLQRLVLQDAEGCPALPEHFDVRGLATKTTTTSGRGAGESLILEVVGTGDLNGEFLIIQGTISAFGGQLEVVADNSGGGVT